MKKTHTFLAILMLAFILTDPVKATGLFTEDFEYPAGTLLSSVGWPALFIGSGTNAIKVTSPGLTYSGYPGSEIGNAVTLGTSGEDCIRDFGSINSGTIYASLMVNVQSAQAAGDYFFSFYIPDSYYAKIYIKDISNQGFEFGLSKYSAIALANWTTTVYNYNTTYLIVVKYAFVSGNSNDLVSLIINPIPGKPEPLQPTLTNTDNGTYSDAWALTSVCLSQGNSSRAPNVQVDGIRVSTTWEDLPLPVELSSFVSNVNGRDINLNWATQTEKNSDKFNIERKTTGTDWGLIGSIKATVLSNSPKQYSYTDKNLQSGKYLYRLKMIDNDGTFEYSKVIETEVSVPKDFELSQNFPNPWNPSTKINYTVPSDSKVILEVYNITGERISQLVNEDQAAGYYSVGFGSSNLSSGVYFYRITTVDKATGNNFSAIKKMIMLK